MMISDMKLKTSLPVIWLENIDFEKSGSVRTQRTLTTDPDPGWSGRWWRCWRDRPRTDPPTLTSDLKKRKIINTHLICIVIDHHFLTLHWLGNRIKYYNLVISYQWSQITFLLSIRRTGSQQIDFKVSSLWMPKIFLEFKI